MDDDSLTALTSEIVDCRACARLVEWRERVAREKRASYADEDYWGRPAPGFGDPAATLLLVGLAPAAHGAYVTAAVRCAPPANKPTPAERDTCLPYLAREWRLLDRVEVVVALGAFAHQVVAGLAGLRPRPRFGHGAEAVLPDGRVLLASYHPSQQNTFTGVLTEDAFDAIFTRARELGA